VIEDFLEVNKLDGKVHSFPSVVSIETVADQMHISKNSIAKAVPFVDNKLDFFVVVLASEDSITSKEANEMFNKKDLVPAQDKEVLSLLAIEKNYFPPIAVYGATTLVHSSVKEKKRLLFALSDRVFLVIATNDIEKTNELNE